MPNYEDKIGTYNTGTLDAIDSVLKQLHTAGIKAIISPHDANLLPPSGSSTGYNGKDIYGSTYGSSDNFYSSNTAKAQYDARLASILNYKSPAFGKAWKDLSEVILAFDIQNEPMIASVGKLQNNDPDDWICGRAGNMKKLIGTSVSSPPTIKTPENSNTLNRVSRSQLVESVVVITAVIMSSTLSTKLSNVQPLTLSPSTDICQLQTNGVTLSQKPLMYVHLPPFNIKQSIH